MQLIDQNQPEIKIEAEMPRGPLGRMRGLIGSDPPPPGTGILLKCRQVHTFAMTFSIDAVYLDRAGRVLAVRTLSPARLGPLKFKARWVLEMSAGEAKRMGIGKTTQFTGPGWPF